MIIEKIEQKFSSEVNKCPFCDNSLITETKQLNHLGDSEVKLYDYTCSCQVAVYKEEKKVTAIEIRNHCRNQTTALHKLLKQK